jgi:hypothetical protein
LTVKRIGLQVIEPWASGSKSIVAGWSSSTSKGSRQL